MKKKLKKQFNISFLSNKTGKIIFEAFLIEISNSNTGLNSMLGFDF